MKHATAPNHEIQATISKLQLALKDVDSNIVHMSCLALAVLMQDPSVSLFTLMETVKSTSEFIHLTLTPTSGSVN